MQISVKESMPRATAPEATRAPGTAALWTYLVAGLLAVFYFVTSIQIAAHRVFWFDELFTLYIARLPHVSTIWTALGNGVDALPQRVEEGEVSAAVLLVAAKLACALLLAAAVAG